jgi:hypothetical protein
MSNKMLSLKVRLEAVPLLQARRRWRLVIELLEQQARRQSELLSETRSQTLRADAASQPPSQNPLVKIGGQR